MTTKQKSGFLSFVFGEKVSIATPSGETIVASSRDIRRLEKALAGYDSVMNSLDDMSAADRKAARITACLYLGRARKVFARFSRVSPSGEQIPVEGLLNEGKRSIHPDAIGIVNKHEGYKVLSENKARTNMPAGILSRLFARKVNVTTPEGEQIIATGRDVRKLEKELRVYDSIMADLAENGDAMSCKHRNILRGIALAHLQAASKAFSRFSRVSAEGVRLPVGPLVGQAKGALHPAAVGIVYGQPGYKIS